MTDDMFTEEPGVDYSKNYFDEMELDEEPTSLIWEEKLPLFGDNTNPNHTIFVVPTQEGADKDDRWNGSIGDAIMEHVQNMRHRIWEMEHYIHMPNGNIFRIEENVGTQDSDGSRRINREIMQVMKSVNKSSSEDKKNVIAYLQSEIEENRRREEEREDAMDQILVPYEDWEAKPQMTKDWDVPSTPKPMFIYAGNSSQMFYDHFPEDHPDSQLINNFLMIANNIDWDDWNEETVKYFQNWLNERTWSIKSVPFHLMDFCNQMATDDGSNSPSDVMADILDRIDREYGSASAKIILKEFRQSPPVKEMVKFYKHNEERHKAGELMWTKVGKLGRSFFRYKDSMTSAHWSAYFRLKKVFAPRVYLGDMDINRASFRDMAINLGEHRAKKIFFARPFMGLEDLVKLGVITSSDIKGTRKNSVFVSMVKSAAQKSMKANTMAYMAKLAQKIVDTQQSRPNLMSEEEWSMVWQTYRICKQETSQEIGLFN